MRIMGWRLSPVRPDSALRAAGELASAGLRILATAVSRAARPDDSGGQRAAGTGTLVYTGLQAMLDPPHPAAAPTVAAARGAGIAATATAVAGSLACCRPSMTGRC
jgi:cation-transporting ATPase F